MTEEEKLQSEPKDERREAGKTKEAPILKVEEQIPQKPIQLSVKTSLHDCHPYALAKDRRSYRKLQSLFKYRNFWR